MAVSPRVVTPLLRATKVLAGAGLALSTTLACGVVPGGTISPSPFDAEPTVRAAPPAPSSEASSDASRTPAPSTAAPQSPAPPATPNPKPKPRVLASDGKPRAARLSIPALDVEDLEVQPHRGSPDDARGTRIQNGGIAASPYGPTGGVGPGGLGNHIITAHRLSSTRAFVDLPKLRTGAKVYLEAGGKRYTYRIVQTRITSFRSTKSLAAQSAPVPGRPGVRATKAMITLSTCRTPEDHAEGNYWSDRFDNPEHRIDKIGELVAITTL